MARHTIQASDARLAAKGWNSMALTKAQKNQKVAALAADLEKSTTAIIGTFTGLTASKDFALRKTVREAGGSYHVVKNKLAARSSQGTKVEAALQGLKGVSGVAYTAGDPVQLAKALSDWVKDNAEFTFKLGIVDGKVITKEEIGALANMPGKEELFGKLLFLINAPATRLATVTNAVSRNLAVVIDQAREQGKLTGTGATASAAPASTPAAAADASSTPTEQIATNPASEADPVAQEQAAGEQPSGAAQPENVTASQGGEAATENPVEG
jgi:large subunit ribosomal protein L10